MLRAVLIANRGEIACRIITTLHRLGIRAIAVYSDADRDARHVALADRAVRIGPPPAAESYLRIDALIEAAARTGADAVHPGYGFLAENAAFARACAAAGVVFIGPDPDVIEVMGAKDRAKAAMAAADVPCVPGWQGEAQDEAALLEAAQTIGFPVLIKAASGGGGKGMRVVETADAFGAALEGARREAKAAFGDDRVLLERFIVRPRHVEAQIFGDAHGNVVHLFERDCSLQRRHQKVIEEAPAPGLEEAQRTALGAAAVRAGKAIGYTGAGTVEFLMDPSDAFFFIEMNTRLQVEHPITEMITGQDLVEWQLRVAAGEPLPLLQDRIRFAGHAIEARLYAEDPARGFLPSTGRLHHLRFPAERAWLRVESGVRAGDEVTPFYDPMLAKLVAHGPDRATALARLREALIASEVVGPTTNLAWLAHVLEHPAFKNGAIDTGFLERTDDLTRPATTTPSARVFARAGLWLLARERRRAAEAARASADPNAPWHRVDGWRLNDVGHQTLRLRAGDTLVEIEARTDGSGFRLHVGEHAYRGRGELGTDGRLRVELDGVVEEIGVVEVGGLIHVLLRGERFALARVDPLAAAEREEETGGVIAAPMPGRIIRRLVSAGDRVARGAPLLVLEAMKMEHTLTAPGAGRISALRCEEGEQVEDGAILLDFEAAAGG